MRIKTSHECERELNNIVWLFVEVEFVGADCGVLASLVEVGFYHFEERDIFALCRCSEPAGMHQPGCQSSADVQHHMSAIIRYCQAC